MGILWKILVAESLVLLGHSGFSSHEFHKLVKNAPQNISSSDLSHIPADIKYEAIVGLGVFVLGIFLSFERLSYYPLRGSHKLLVRNQFLQDIDMSKANNVNNLIGRDPSGIVTYTPNFVDIHAKRKQIREELSLLDGEKSTKE